jgi:hypothetical protein
VAQAVVANEERIAEIQKELAGEVTAERKAELSTELTERQNAAVANASFIKGIEAEVAEARRVAGLSELQRAIEEYQQKSALIQAEYNERKGALEAELQDLKDQKKEEKKLYEEKTKFILEQMLTAAQSQYALASGAVAATKAQIEKEIEYYAALAKAIQAARSGNVSEVNRAKASVVGAREYGGPVTAGLPYVVGEGGPEIFTPSTSGRISAGGGTVINVTIANNKFVSPREEARMLGSELVRYLKDNMKV